MRSAWKKIRLALKAATKFLPLMSRKACYRLALLLGCSAHRWIAGAEALR
jgi:hypothetical protein